MTILTPFYKVLGWLLAVFYWIVPDLGVAIILLTVAIMLLIYPLVVKQTKSMIAMQRINPELQKLRAKYKGPENRAKLNEETMRLFQERKINPMASCLPLVPQMFILIVLNGVLRHPYKYVPETGKFSQLYHDFCPGYPKVSACEKAFEADKAGHLGFISTNFLDLRLSALDNHGSLIHYVPYFALVVGVAAASYLMSSLSMKRNAAPNPQMAKVMKFLPLFFAVISLNFPAGLVLYFFVSSVWRVGQQELIYRRHVHDADSPVDDAKGSRTRTATQVIDVEGRDVEADAEEPSPPKPIAGKSRTPAPWDPPARTTPPSRSTPPAEVQPTDGTPVADGAASGRGLRALFRPPPAPAPARPGSTIPPKGPNARIDKGRPPGSRSGSQRPTGAGKKKKR